MSNKPKFLEVMASAAIDLLGLIMLPSVCTTLPADKHINSVLPGREMGFCPGQRSLELLGSDFGCLTRYYLQGSVTHFIAWQRSRASGTAEITSEELPSGSGEMQFQMLAR